MPTRMAHLLVRSVNILVDKRMTSGEIGHLIGEKARASVTDLVSRGLVPPLFETLVDNVPGASEDAVKIDGGLIEYRFHRLGEAAAFAFSFCRQLSPYRSGDFFHGWIIVVDGQAWEGEIDAIPASVKSIIITNPAPFTTRLEMTVGRHHPAYHITEAAARATKSRFPSLNVTRRFVTIPGGVGSWGPVPYVRKRPPGGAILYPGVLIESRI
jgi:hypothetical protein